MAKPINHDFASGTATTAWSAVKGGLLGVVISALVIGAVAAGAVALLGSLGIAFGAAVTGGAFGASMFSGLGGAVTAAAGIVGAAFGAASSTIPAAIFGGLGALTGMHKVSVENRAFNHKAERYARTQEMERNNVAMAGMQQGYQAGFQEGQQYVVSQLRAAQEQMMMNEALKAHGGHAAKIMQQREAAQNAVKQV